MIKNIVNVVSIFLYEQLVKFKEKVKSSMKTFLVMIFKIVYPLRIMNWKTLDENNCSLF